jgi:hypothetical protein
MQHHLLADSEPQSNELFGSATEDGPARRTNGIRSPGQRSLSGTERDDVEILKGANSQMPQPCHAVNVPNEDRNYDWTTKAADPTTRPFLSKSLPPCNLPVKKHA